MIILSLFNFTHKLSISSHRVQRITVTLTDVVFDSVQEEQSVDFVLTIWYLFGKIDSVTVN